MGDRKAPSRPPHGNKDTFQASRRFAERGYAHVTLQEIADDAGVTPALVNRCFVSGSRAVH
ncbi:helix-turn-helix domain-containing protein [Streptomyces sp. NPDC005970]|uniref:helix-turn-helix domain-containing protein n=1 Tax=Streptomyces sp. NPDC005970 TaxID=3156723 RepID=UPI0033D4AF27